VLQHKQKKLKDSWTPPRWRASFIDARRRGGFDVSALSKEQEWKT
jgi:hypothetical protein